VTFLLTPPSPLKCHVLFEWPLSYFSPTNRIGNKTIFSILATSSAKLSEPIEIESFKISDERSA
jgi:hypothetical protein